MGALGALALSLGVIALVWPVGRALVVGTLGAGLVVLGLRRGSWRVHFLGSVGLLGCVVIASLAGVGTPRTLAGGGLAVVAWDAGRYALDLSTDVSVAAGTWRVEALHLLAVGSGTAFVLGFEYVLLRGVAGGRSLLGLSALLVGVLALLLALQRRAYGDGVDGRSA